MSPSHIASRDNTIDYLRAASIIVMIILHINPYFPRLAFSQAFVNWGQWVVPAFLFCSIAVSMHRLPATPIAYLQYIRKRIQRLLIPYFLFLGVYLGFAYAYAHKPITLQLLWKNITLTGGIDYNWLVLLFILLTLTLPLLAYLKRRAPVVFVAIMGVSIVASVVFFSNRTQWASAYRLWMGFSWVSVFCGLMLYADWIKKKALVPLILTTFFSAIVCVATFWHAQANALSVSTFSHKYPPDILFVAYCLFTTPFAYAVAKAVAKLTHQLTYLTRMVRWISTHSYTIFFTHLIVLFALDVPFPTRPFSYAWFSFLLFTITCALVWVWERGSEAITPQKHPHKET